MKLKQIALLVAGLSASASVFAAPVTLSEIQSASLANLDQAWITGASAPTKTVYEGWVGASTGAGCDADTNAVFTSAAALTGTQTSTNTPGSLGNFTAYACKKGTRIRILYHTLDGGSLNAYTPHTVGTVLARLGFLGTNTTCALTANQPGTSYGYVDPTNAQNNAAVYRACTRVGAQIPATGVTPAFNNSNRTAIQANANAPQLPVGGFSDVEAALWPSSIGGGAVSSRGVEANVGAGQVFGVAASIPLYRAMQAAQGLTQNDDPANAPNITTAQYTSVIAQGGSAGFDGTWTPVFGQNPGNVRVMRRVDTSGTQASSNAYFLKNPCANGVGANLSPTTAADNGDTYEVVLNSGSGDVKKGLTTASNNASNPALAYAIGVLSAENNWRVDPSTDNGYRYLKLDGVHPEAGDTENARITAANSQYKFHMELKSFVRSNYAGVPAKTTFENGIIGEITTALRTPAAAACAVFPRGLTLNPNNNSACTVGVQVAKMTNDGKNCATPFTVK